MDQRPLLSFKERLASLARAKLILFISLIPLWTTCYYLPQAFPLTAPRQLPLWWIDRAIPFEPWWIFPYMSMYLLLPIPPLLSTTLPQIRRYVAGMMIMFLTAAIFFFATPVIYPRPDIPAGANAFYKLIAGIDKPINTIPSLHAGLTVYAMLVAATVLRDLSFRRRVILLSIGWIWGMIILYATLGSKQHYFIDLPPGALLALVSYWMAGQIVKRNHSLRRD